MTAQRGSCPPPGGLAAEFSRMAATFSRTATRSLATVGKAPSIQGSELTVVAVSGVVEEDLEAAGVLRLPQLPSRVSEIVLVSTTKAGHRARRECGDSTQDTMPDRAGLGMYPGGSPFGAEVDGRKAAPNPPKYRRSSPTDSTDHDLSRVLQKGSPIPASAQ